MIRTLWTGLWAVALTLWHGARILWASRLRTRGWEEVCDRAPRSWAQGILRAAGVRIVFEDVHNLETDGPQVLVANHVSWFDVLVLAGYIPRRYCFVGKKELASVPVFGPAWQACGHIAIDRQDRDAAVESLNRARERMEDQAPTVILFPEGTRSPDGALKPFKKGAFVLAIQAGAPVVPVAIVGSRDVLAKHHWRVRSGTIRVRVGEPIPTDGLTMEDRDRLREEVWEAVHRLLETAGEGAGPTHT